MKKIILLFSILITSISSFGQVVINEYSVSNLSSYLDNYGGEEDWIDQLIKFIQLHAKYPVITLCKECHLAMNKIHEPLKVRLQYRRGGIKVSIKIK